MPLFVGKFWTPLFKKISKTQTSPLYEGGIPTITSPSSHKFPRANVKTLREQKSKKVKYQIRNKFTTKSL